jgi:hypothetical protein
MKDRGRALVGAVVVEDMMAVAKLQARLNRWVSN